MKKILKITFLFTLITFLPSSLFAAAPVTHAVLAQKWIEHREHYNDKQKEAFILGTLFPDIRYLGVISREKTHEKGLTLPHLLEKQTAFNKGKRLHAFVDETREALIAKWKMYDHFKKIPGAQHKVMFLKFLEDEILFSRQNWDPIHRYLSTLHKEEKQFGISVENLKKWHHNQLRAFTYSPSQYLAQLSAKNQNFASITPDILHQWSELLPKLAKDKKMNRYVDKLITEFDKLFQSVKS